MKLTKSYSKRITKALSVLSFEHLSKFKEVNNAANNIKIFYCFSIVDDHAVIRLMGFNLNITEHVFDLYLDFTEGSYITSSLQKYKDKIVCHPHIFVNPKYRGLGIMASILSIYYKRNIEFVFSSLTKEGLSFMKRWYKQNNIKYSFFDVEGNPRRENDKRVFYLGTSLK
jgi:hypothetical protein